LPSICFSVYHTATEGTSPKASRDNGREKPEDIIQLDGRKHRHIPDQPHTLLFITTSIAASRPVRLFALVHQLQVVQESILVSLRPTRVLKTQTARKTPVRRIKQTGVRSFAEILNSVALEEESFFCRCF
jgi:hypothetical protein